MLQRKDSKGLGERKHWNGSINYNLFWYLLSIPPGRVRNSHCKTFRKCISEGSTSILEVISLDFVFVGGNQISLPSNCVISFFFLKICITFQNCLFYLFSFLLYFYLLKHHSHSAYSCYIIPSLKLHDQNSVYRYKLIEMKGWINDTLTE